MSFNVLIVEDQPLVALNLQDTVEELGHHAVGIASNMYQALLLADHVDMALVDVNLEGRLARSSGEHWRKPM
ncbi:hypothetical protein [Rhizobium grahamii]|uniref:hypothetical protein n=1 Tax=Rhizobium grahamii TaxID=1120045 RepID=UPI003D7C3510